MFASEAPRFTPEELNFLSSESGWPLDILTDPTKQPRIVNTVEELKRATFFEDFTDECVILPNGVQLLGLQDVIPKDFTDLINGNHTVLGLIESFTEDMYAKFQGKICYAKENGKDDEPDVDCLKGQLQYIKDSNNHRRNLYLTELRYKKKYKHPVTNENTKTACLKDGKDVMGEQTEYGSLYWDRYDTGIFIGNSGSGMGLHSDQVFWSNFGKNWSGYKLLALWKSGKTSVDLLEKFRHSIFAREPYGRLEEEEMEQVENVHRVCLLKPGDVMIFSAAGAHMAISLCDTDELAVSAYESFINFNPEHIKTFLQTGNKEFHHRKFIMAADDVYDIKDDMLDTLEIILDKFHLLSPERQTQFRKSIDVLKENCTYFDRHITKILDERDVKLNHMAMLQNENEKEHAILKSACPLPTTRANSIGGNNEQQKLDASEVMVN